MTRRTTQSAAAAARANTATLAPTHAHPTAPAAAAVDASFAVEYAALRRNWKWANFSQFFYTFNALFNMPDISLADIEDDLARSSMLVLPRIMHRLLVVLTQDRKLSAENWQNSLRKQYARRDSGKNPIGPAPVKSTRTPSPEPVELPDIQPDADAASGQTNATAPAETDTTTADTATASEAARYSSAPSSPSAEYMDAELSAEAVPLEESRDWMALSMLEKLDSLHLLTEWQFQNVTRLRQTMKSDDENATWRIEPIGYDAKANAYWVIGSDRLWIQRVPPKPSRSLKRKRPAAKSKKRAPEPDPEGDFDASAEPEPDSKRVRTVRGKQEMVPPSGGRGARAAKLQANKKLDEQAKELAELKRQAALEQRQTTRTARVAPRPTGGTRISRRLHGAEADAEWQEIPEEWLKEGRQDEEGQGKKDESDAESELTDLSELEAEELEPASEPKQEQEVEKPVLVTNGRSKGKGKARTKATEVVPEPEAEHEEAEPEWRPPDDWVEWETLCVTLYDWEHIAERFQNATHYAEKALYKVLTQVYVPEIAAELREIERKRRMEEAVTQRKRSSRLAIKDQEKEEQRLAEIRRQEEEEKMSRVRRLEARQKREEEERIKRENAREQRRKEREEREARRHALVEAQEQEESSLATTPIDVVNEDLAPEQKSAVATPAKTPRKRQKPAEKIANGEAGEPGKATPKRAGRKVKGADGAGKPGSEEWELDCEICDRRGKNLDDDLGLVSCGRCGKWQHIRCYDAADKRAGRTRRDWEKEEFMCQRCRAYTPVTMSFPTTGPTIPSYKTAVGVQAYGSSGPQPYGSTSGITYSHYQPGAHHGQFALPASQHPSLPSSSAYGNGSANGLLNKQYSPGGPMLSGWPGSSAPPPVFPPSSIHPSLQSFMPAPPSTLPTLPPMNPSTPHAHLPPMTSLSPRPSLPPMTGLNGFGGAGAYGASQAYTPGYSYTHDSHASS
ncbi:hypothetical protein K488DRAFT_68310 [Vararia minispora EC-137]|uniref:Uncharacterized protein n=1 Tax=Vararia minispora EC-137 TaxID=1314806 RepID=A0ACB8QV04_9AGAM|nr:hypothetical protein K488DRAFT_68310 [Vararia minispora EC-137]